MFDLIFQILIQFWEDYLQKKGEQYDIHKSKKAIRVIKIITINIIGIIGILIALLIIVVIRYIIS